MRFFERLKNQIRRGRIGKALRVNLRWGMRRCRRFFRREEFIRGIKGAFARRLYAACGILLFAAIAGAVAQTFAGRWSPDEAALCARLQNSEPDPKDAVESTLASFGSSNRIQIILKTAKEQNLRPQGTALTRGNISLIMQLKDGKVMEYTLRNKRIANFQSGQTDYFTLILPEGIAPFDIIGYRLVLLPDAKGRYDEWYCETAQIACLLGGERQLLAAGEWEGIQRFSAESASMELPIESDANSYYQQINAIYPYALQVYEAQGALHTNAIKDAANIELGMMSGDTLYLDIETVSLENQNAVLGSLPELIEKDPLDYDGTMTLRVQFIRAAEGSYYKDYRLDTPGKDDFELGTTSTFMMEMPEGLSAFDICGLELLVEDPDDSWAPRMIRAYLRTDYGMLLEIARETDVRIAEERKSGIFLRGRIETQISPLRLSLDQSFSLPKALKTKIEKQYFTEIEGVIYSMYFGDHNFSERRALYYSQVLALYGDKK